MRNSINELDKFINEDNSLHPLICCALIHYQFETINPFLDRNGRIGRMLILLYLMNKGILTTPVLTISYYLKSHQLEYYDQMSEVRKTGNYEQWVNFFLQAIITSVNDEIESINELNTLREITTKRIQESNYSNHDKLVLLEFKKTWNKNRLYQ